MIYDITDIFLGRSIFDQSPSPLKYISKRTQKFIANVINPMGPVSVCESSWESKLL